MPLIATRGAASAQGFGEFASSSEPVYIESCFSTYLYTGNNSTQTITNGIDLSGKGGLVWSKGRNTTYGHVLFDTARGTGYWLMTQSTSAQQGTTGDFSSFNSNGYTLGAPFDISGTGLNGSGNIFASWTFRKQPKFFDVVTYTGNGTDDRAISHNLGSTPGCYMVKATSTTSDWLVYHRGNPFAPGEGLALNLTSITSSTYSPAATAPTSTVFYVGRSGGGPTNNGNVNGVTYVAYLFAHDAGGFGLSGTDNVISCGSYVGNALSDGPTITLGYEPQWILVKDASVAANWQIVDTMRGLTVESDNVLRPNTTAAEYAQNLFSPTATGFKVTTTSSDVNREFSTFIYIAIRRGPMKTPTSGTSVFQPLTYSGDNADPKYLNTSGITQDLMISSRRNNAENHEVFDRLRGNQYLITNLTDAAQNGSASRGVTLFTSNRSGNLVANIAGSTVYNASGDTYCWWTFARAPGFFDVVCYTGNGSSGRAINHNLGVAPELMVVKSRSNAGTLWTTYSASVGNTKAAYLNSDQGFATDTYWANTTPTSTVFTVGLNGDVNSNGATYVAYLFATVAGVSKVGSYTGTGTTLQVNCGFTGGARFVLIKRTDSTGDWYVWDSARGIVAGNDPYLLLNSTAAEVTSTDYVDTYSAGFEISSTAPAAINANGGTFIFLAIA